MNLYRRTFILFILLSVLITANGQYKYHIVGSLTNSDGKKIYLRSKGYMINRNLDKYEPIDSCIFKNGHFEFKGSFKEKGFFSIDIIDTSNDWHPFLRDTGIIYIKGGSVDKVYTSRVNGSKENAEAEDFKNNFQLRIYRMFDMAQDSAWNAGNRGDLRVMKIYDDTRIFHQRQMKEYIQKFIKSHPDNFHSAYLLYSHEWLFEKTETINLFETLSMSLQRNTFMKKKRLQLFEAPENLKNSDLAIDFSMNTAKGKPINSKDYKGKYLLINFWASWCVPCIAEMPDLIKLYEKYHPAGLEIISISWDIDAENWYHALSKLDLPWENVSDFKGAESRISVMYDVGSIPRNILISPSGRISNLNIKKEELITEIEKAFVE